MWLQWNIFSSVVELLSILVALQNYNLEAIKIEFHLFFGKFLFRNKLITLKVIWEVSTFCVRTMWTHFHPFLFFRIVWLILGTEHTPARWSTHRQMIISYSQSGYSYNVSGDTEQTPRGQKMITGQIGFSQLVTTSQGCLHTAIAHKIVWVEYICSCIVPKGKKKHSEIIAWKFDFSAKHCIWSLLRQCIMCLKKRHRWLVTRMHLNSGIIESVQNVQ